MPRNGAPFLGNSAFALTLDAEPGTGALLLLGQPTELALTPCELRVTNLLTPLFVAVDGGGRAQLGLPVPASADLAGARLGAQWAVLQTGGPFLGALALSNGVDLILQAQ